MGVKEAVPQEDYTLLLPFVNGGKRVCNALPLLSKTIAADVKSLPFFLTARDSGDIAVLNDEVDEIPS